MDKADRIRTLSKKEIAVLYWICMGLNNREIEEELGIPDKTRSSQQTRIYAKLEITGDDAKKRDILLTEYCRIVKEIVNLESLKTWIPIKPLPEDVERYAIIEYNNPDELVPVAADVEPEPQPRLQPRQEQDSKAIPYVPEKEARDRLRRWVLGLSAVIIVLIVAIWYIVTRLTPEIPLNLPSNTPENTSNSVLVSEVTQTSTATDEPTATKTPKPTSTPKPTAAQTDTQTPTTTPTETATPIPPLASTDFDAGLPSDWSVYLGDPLIVNGMLSANAPAWLEMGDSNWTDIKVEYDVNLSSYADCREEALHRLWKNYTMFVGLRYQDNDNMIALKTGQCGFLWFRVKNGVWEAMPGKGIGAWYGSFKKITIIVKGNTYTAYVDGIKSTSFVDDSFQTGKVGLRLGKESYIDNFAVNSSP